MEERQNSRDILLRVALFLFLHKALVLGASFSAGFVSPVLAKCFSILAYLIPGMLAFRLIVRRKIPPLVRTAGSFRAALPLFPILLACLLLISSLTALILHAFGVEASGSVAEPDLLRAIVFNCYLPAMLEELLFRATLLPLLLQADRRHAVWLNGLLFALIHTSLYQIPYTFCGGVILALTALIAGPRTAFFFHFLNNLCVVLFARGELYFGGIFNVVLLPILAVLAVGAGIFLFLYRADPHYAPLREFFTRQEENGTACIHPLLSPLGVWCLLALGLTLINTFS